jgi:hypothetical protein
MPACCPLCRQPVGEVRAGVRLPMLKAQIFDTIHAAGEMGITAREIMHAVYGDQKRVLTTIRMHIAQINDILEETDTKIKTFDRRMWIVSRSKKTQDAA